MHIFSRLRGRVLTDSVVSEDVNPGLVTHWADWADEERTTHQALCHIQLGLLHLWNGWSVPVGVLPSTTVSRLAVLRLGPRHKGERMWAVPHPNQSSASPCSHWRRKKSGCVMR